jgi:hypothetical protein
VICVALFTVKLLTVIPGPKLTVVAPVRLVPVMITVIGHCPWVPLAGLTLVTVGGGTTVNNAVPVPVPPGPVTETSLAPNAASAAMHISAVICVSLLTVKLFTVMPVPKLTAVAPVKLVPVMITVIGHCP